MNDEEKTGEVSNHLELRNHVCEVCILEIQFWERNRVVSGKE